MNVPLCYRRDKPVGPAKTGFFGAILRRRSASVPAPARRAPEQEHRGRRATRRATRRIRPPGPGEPPNKVGRRPTGPRARVDDKSSRRQDFVCARWVTPSLLAGTYRPSAILPAPPLMTPGRIRLCGRPACRRACGPATDRAGFEPAVPLTRYAGLANRCLQPLGHLSGLKTHSRPLQGGCQWPTPAMSCQRRARSRIHGACPFLRPRRRSGRSDVVDQQTAGEQSLPLFLLLYCSR